MIQNMKNVIFAGVFASMLLALALPSITLAQGFAVPPAGANAGLAQGGTDGDIVGAFQEIITFLASILAVLAILVIVIAGILYITSGGDQGRIDTAKSWILYAIIGLIVALLAWVIVNTVAGALNAG